VSREVTRTLNVWWTESVLAGRVWQRVGSVSALGAAGFPNNSAAETKREIMGSCYL
jgi:hypothetical protein